MSRSFQADILDRASLIPPPDYPYPDLGLQGPQEELPPPPGANVLDRASLIPPPFEANMDRVSLIPPPPFEANILDRASLIPPPNYSNPDAEYPDNEQELPSPSGANIIDRASLIPPPSSQDNILDRASLIPPPNYSYPDAEYQDNEQELPSPPGANILDRVSQIPPPPFEANILDRASLIPPPNYSYPDAEYQDNEQELPSPPGANILDRASLILPPSSQVNILDRASLIPPPDYSNPDLGLQGSQEELPSPPGANILERASQIPTPPFEANILDRASLIPPPNNPYPDLVLQGPQQELPPPPLDLPSPLEHQEKNIDEIQPLVLQNIPAASTQKELGDDNLPSLTPKDHLLSPAKCFQPEGCKPTLGVQDLQPSPLPGVPELPLRSPIVRRAKEKPPSLPMKAIKLTPKTKKVSSTSKEDFIPYPMRELPPIPTQPPPQAVQPLSPVLSQKQVIVKVESVDDYVQMQRFLTSVAARVTCPSCKSTMSTTTERKVGTRTHLVALLLCMIGCWPCICLPYCMDNFKDTNHYCSTCGVFQGKHEFSL